MPVLLALLHLPRRLFLHLPLSLHSRGAHVTDTHRPQMLCDYFGEVDFHRFKGAPAAVPTADSVPVFVTRCWGRGWAASCHGRTTVLPLRMLRRRKRPSRNLINRVRLSCVCGFARLQLHLLSTGLGLARITTILPPSSSDCIFGNPSSSSCIIVLTSVYCVKAVIILTKFWEKKRSNILWNRNVTVDFTVSIVAAFVSQFLRAAITAL